MSKYELSTDINNRVCETYECKNEATEVIKVNFGKFGNITLNLCKNCISKFES